MQPSYFEFIVLVRRGVFHFGAYENTVKISETAPQTTRTTHAPAADSSTCSSSTVVLNSSTSSINSASICYVVALFRVLTYEYKSTFRSKAAAVVVPVSICVNFPMCFVLRHKRNTTMLTDCCRKPSRRGQNLLWRGRCCYLSSSARTPLAQPSGSVSLRLKVATAAVPLEQCAPWHPPCPEHTDPKQHK